MTRRTSATSPVFRANGGTVLPEADATDVDYVLFMPGRDFEIVEEEVFEEAQLEDDEAMEDTTMHAVPDFEVYDEEDDFEDEAPTLLRSAPQPERPAKAWWQAARQGVRAIRID